MCRAENVDSRVSGVFYKNGCVHEWVVHIEEMLVAQIKGKKSESLSHVS